MSLEFHLVGFFCGLPFREVCKPTTCEIRETSDFVHAERFGEKETSASRAALLDGDVRLKRPVEPLQLESAISATNRFRSTANLTLARMFNGALRDELEEMFSSFNRVVINRA